MASIKERYARLRPSIKERYARFQAWKQNGPVFKVKESTGHTCACCGYEYEGNYCPVCAQKAGQRRITCGALRESALDLWGLGTRSMPFSIWQLILRPGYFIADYISGKRQVSFPPVKMLFFVTVIILLIENIFGVTQANMKIDLDDEISIFNITIITINWLEENRAWASLILLSFFIIPTYLICRESPRCNRHTLPESFFIQVFIGVQMSVWVLLTRVLPKDNEASDAIILLIMLGLVWFRTYYQLFGYSVWGTLWRMVAVWWNGVILLLSALIFELVGHTLWTTRAMSNEVLGALAFGLILLMLVGIGLPIAWYIDHRRAKPATTSVNQTAEPNETEQS